MGDAGAQQSAMHNGICDTLPTAKKLNVGVVGIGRMGQRHALNLLHRVPRANLLCACSPAKPDLIWAEEHLKGVKVTETFEEMIDTPGLDAVIIASATHLHLEHTLAALDKGIHVLCEKPVCESITDLKALVDRSKATPDTKLMVGFVRRFDEDYRLAYDKIQGGAIGKPIVFRSQGCEKLDISPFYKEYLRISGGMFLDSTIHDIDLALLFLGDDSIPKSASAVGVAAIHIELAELGDADNAVGVCEFWDGKIAYFYSSRTGAHGYDNPTEIYGTAGKISINLTPRRNRVEVSDGSGFMKTEPIIGWYDRYISAFVNEAVGWVDAVLDDKPMPVPIFSTLTSLNIATALQESLKTGRKIEFDREGLRKEG